MTLSKLLNRLGLAVLYLLRLDADECLSCGEVFRGRVIAWAPAARCPNCAPAATLREPIGPPPEPKPLPAPRPLRAPAGPEVERARSIASRMLEPEAGRARDRHRQMMAEVAALRPHREVLLAFDDLADALVRGMPRPDLVIRVRVAGIVGGGGPDCERVVDLVVEVGAIVEAANCLTNSWQVNAWVTRELERMCTGVMLGYVVRASDARGDLLGIVRKGCLTSYVLDLSGTTARGREPRTFES
jgi:hypothetical protein